MKINTELIEKTLIDAKNEILDICTSDDLTISTFEPKIKRLEDFMSTLDKVSIFVEDKSFTNEFTALDIVSKRIIDNQFECLENKDFRNSQIDSLHNFGVDLNYNSTPSNKNNIEKNIIADKSLTNSNENKLSDTKELTPKEKVDLLVSDANEEISTYFTDPSLMKEYLDYISKFYKYSSKNIVLIEKQFEGAVGVGSFKFWKDNGFRLNKGEKGIKILVPAKTTYLLLDDNVKQLKYATKEEKEKIKKGEIPTMVKTYYKTGYVYDISQTNAKESDLPRLFPNRWIDGDVKDYDKMYKAMEKIADTIGVKIIEPKKELGMAKGVSYPLTKEVTLNPRNSQLQNVEVLIHELAHAKLHTMETRNNYTREEREYQAEMVAYTVCSYLGLDVKENSLDYLHDWSKDLDLKKCTSIIEEVKETSTQYIKIIEDFIQNEPSLSLENDSIDKKKQIDKNNISTTLEKSELVEKSISPLSNNQLKQNKSIPTNNLNDICKEIKKICTSDNLEYFGLGYSLTCLEVSMNNIKEDIHKSNNNTLKNNFNTINKILKEIDSSKRDFINDNNLRTSYLNKVNNLSYENKSNSYYLDKLYVKFNSSKTKELENGDIYDFKNANEIVSLLSEKYVSLDTPMATNFEIHSNKDCTKCMYKGSMNIGNGLDYDLKNHMYNRVKNEPNLPEQMKQSYLKLFAPKKNINSKEISK